MRGCGSGARACGRCFLYSQIARPMALLELWALDLFGVRALDCGRGGAGSSGARAVLLRLTDRTAFSSNGATGALIFCVCSRWIVGAGGRVALHRGGSSYWTNLRCIPSVEGGGYEAGRRREGGGCEWSCFSSTECISTYSYSQCTCMYFDVWRHVVRLRQVRL